MGRLFLFLMVFGLAAAPTGGHADTGHLTLQFGPSTLEATAPQVLARPDAAEVTIPADPAYGDSRHYRAVPLLALLAGLSGGLSDTPYDTLEVSATDGFVSQIPLLLIQQGASGGAVAWIAVEDPAHPWPNLPGKEASAGPFYLVWEHPERSGIRTEQWPYSVASLTGVESAPHRWPQIVVDAALPADAPARQGQALFITLCMTCHRMLGGGAADVGPDLGQPMNPTEYLTPTGLRAIIRNPKAVRTWPDQRMVGFDEAALSDADLSAVVAYLREMASHKRTATTAQ